MIRLRIAGGLGNQLFQIGLALTANKRTGLKIRICTGSLSGYRVPRTFLADKVLALPASVSLSEQVGTILRLRLARWWRPPIPRVLLVGDHNVGQLFTPHPGVRRIFLDGYFCESLTQEQFDEVCRTVRPYVRTGDREPMAANECILHVRGGDFRTLGITGVSQVGYYADAIKTLEARHHRLTYKIITDDVEYAKHIARDLHINCAILSGDPLADFQSLRRARYLILSSSTFAFWAAALSEEATPDVIAPTFWRPNSRRRILLPCEKHRLSIETGRGLPTM